MHHSEFYQYLKKHFPFEATLKQDMVLQHLARFVLSERTDILFLLKGYAGTGKTTLMGTLVKNLPKIGRKAILLAPTGRAAKVIGNYAGANAQTIHRAIYYPKKTSNGGMSFQLKQNKFRNTLFIIDEASMISDGSTDGKMFEHNSLLDDLILYIYSGNGCRALIMGDTAQLPPVKVDISPALDADLMASTYQKYVHEIELDEVVRQASDSGILMNATVIREQISSNFDSVFEFQLNKFKDVIRLTDGYDILDAINDSYSEYGQEETVVIVRSNKRANMYNNQIRSRVLYKEEEIAAGDFLMVVKNNYFWLAPTSEAGFIANGDVIQVLEIFAIKELYDFRFAEVKVAMVDYPDLPAFETTLLLTTLTVETPSLPHQDSNKLYHNVLEDYANESSKYKRFLKVKSNPFFNALQVKFSYAITCHKSQGGQWKRVFIEQPYLPDGISISYLRWLYTAVTRAQEKVYLMGFKDEFFEPS